MKKNLKGEIYNAIVFSVGAMAIASLGMCSFAHTEGAIGVNAESLSQVVLVNDTTIQVDNVNEGSEVFYAVNNGQILQVPPVPIQVHGFVPLNCDCVFSVILTDKGMRQNTFEVNAYPSKTQFGNYIVNSRYFPIYLQIYGVGDKWLNEDNAFVFLIDSGRTQIAGISIFGYDGNLNDGYEEGYQTGFEEGQSQGYDNGYDVGYNNGYGDGVEEDFTNNGLIALFNAILSAPATMFSNAFNFEIFGLNFGSLVSVLLTIGIVVMVISIFVGKKE